MLISVVKIGKNLYMIYNLVRHIYLVKGELVESSWEVITAVHIDHFGSGLPLPGT